MVSSLLIAGVAEQLLELGLADDVATHLVLELEVQFQPMAPGAWPSA